MLGLQSVYKSRLSELKLKENKHIKLKLKLQQPNLPEKVRWLSLWYNNEQNAFKNFKID